MQPQLKDTAYELSVLYASALPGEPFHPDYEKDKEAFRMLVNSDIEVERQMKKYFRQLLTRLDKLINWKYFESQSKEVRTAAISDLFTAEWVGEELFMRVLLTDALQEAIMSGVLFTMKEFKVDLGWNSTEAPFTDYLRKHTLSLSKDLNKTTKDRVAKILQQSISLGETTDEAAKRLVLVINNPKRAATIAHTESVNAFTNGRLEVGRAIGMTKKEWSATIGACPICKPLDGKIVGIDKLFVNRFMGPVAHPNCRCLVRLVP